MDGIFNSNYLVFPIEKLGLSPRPVHCLTQAGITNVEDLISTTEDDLMRIPGLGRKSLEEIINKLKALGLELAF